MALINSAGGPRDAIAGSEVVVAGAFAGDQLRDRPRAHLRQPFRLLAAGRGVKRLDRLGKAEQRAATEAAHEKATVEVARRFYRPGGP